MKNGVAYAPSPMLASPTPAWRSRFIMVLMALAFAGLLGRAVYIQVIQNEFFRLKGEVRYARTLTLQAHRGRILDRNGVVLASSTPMTSIWAIPNDVQSTPDSLKKLARVLAMPVADVSKKLQGVDKTFVWLKRHVDESVAKEVAKLGLEGVHQRVEYKRQYPEGEVAAHVVGFNDVEDQGIGGIELAFNRELGGRNGSRRVIKNRKGRVVEDVVEQVAPVDGLDVHLSMDSRLQFFAFQQIKAAVQQHKAQSGSVVVLDVQTGEVLAMANYPSFMPDQRQKPADFALRNRALTDPFEPGSTMKPFVIALALNKGIVTPNTLIQAAPGSMTVGNFTIKDSHAHGMLSVSEVIQKSSNIGTARIAMKLSAREMWEMYSSVGFGQKPLQPFPRVVRGQLRPYKAWRPVEQATMSYGYGVSVSLMQLARAYTLFARDGDVMPASLLKVEMPAASQPVIQGKVAREVRQMLHLVTGVGGTAPLAQSLGYSVGGKTGTAYKYEGRGRGYAANKYRGVFAGIAPIDHPRIAVAVMIDEPSGGLHFGGDVAAPVFSLTVQQTLRVLGVTPDMAVESRTVDRLAEEGI